MWQTSLIESDLHAVTPDSHIRYFSCFFFFSFSKSEVFFPHLLCFLPHWVNILSGYCQISGHFSQLLKFTYSREKMIFTAALTALHWTELEAKMLTISLFNKMPGCCFPSDMEEISRFPLCIVLSWRHLHWSTTNEDEISLLLSSYMSLFPTSSSIYRITRKRSVRF